MQRTCSACRASYDDAVCWTFCPHDRFISDEHAARKDLAHSLMGKPLLFDGVRTRVNYVCGDGMVEIDGFTGQFAPHLFMIVDA